MTDPCYTNPADAACASFKRTDAGAPRGRRGPRRLRQAAAAAAAYLGAPACRAAAAAAAPRAPRAVPRVGARACIATCLKPSRLRFCSCLVSAEWTDDLEKLCQAMPFMVGCSMWKACTVGAAAPHAFGRACAPGGGRARQRMLRSLQRAAGSWRPRCRRCSWGCRGPAACRPVCTACTACCRACSAAGPAGPPAPPAGRQGQGRLAALLPHVSGGQHLRP